MVRAIQYRMTPTGYRAIKRCGARHRDGQMSTRELVTAVLSVADHWQQDLSQIPGLVELVTADLDAILTCGMRDAVKPLC